MIDPTTTAGATRVAVLGATGCVGRAVCVAYARGGARVVGIARTPPPRAEYPFRSLDLAATAPADLARILAEEGVDTVVNAAGGWGRAEELRRGHVRLVRRLVAALGAMETRPRLVHIGSVHEYGPIAEGTSVSENTVPRPDSAYGRVKLAGSRIVLRAAQAGTVDAVVLRAVNVYGPYTTPTSFLGALRERLRRAGPEGLTVRVAPARRDFVDARDLADAVVLAGRAPVNGKVINIGRGVAEEVRELVQVLLETAGLRPGAVPLVDAPVSSNGGAWTRADIRQARCLLGWCPRAGVRESIEALWEQG
ncbi:NAD-dependent epimerase/dehydratase family protein [Micromonospora sp. ALFpr18c]|uniref:NAD-dependent epimerase/dehydratase family protein n=1 Tax=unclassified Micromonospora TaxID=2617518 RepID=UPI00124B6FE5|nr:MULTISPECIES: NAD-dependent epimerase/dehydratase family protein [unclassified Micromonospora]KAB1948723.1 NAD-dependent epimerase/dehydratase family protein [Micromonospora sp. ALFpr18c]MDG4758518.1 NAD-dependent epimerase/dehydratase family protein [Micromonospora sp. WMMD710]